MGSQHSKGHRLSDSTPGYQGQSSTSPQRPPSARPPPQAPPPPPVPLPPQLPQPSKPLIPVAVSRSNPGDTNTRAAAAEAAEKRLKAAQARGTSAANPHQGRLAAQVQAQKASKLTPEPKQDDKLVWD